jgi:hypothetical protein
VLVHERIASKQKEEARIFLKKVQLFQNYQLNLKQEENPQQNSPNKNFVKTKP